MNEEILKRFKVYDDNEVIRKFFELLRKIIAELNLSADNKRLAIDLVDEHKRIAVNINGRLVLALQKEKGKTFFSFMVHRVDEEAIEKTFNILHKGVFKEVITPADLIKISKEEVLQKNISIVLDCCLKACREYLPLQEMSQYRRHHVAELYEIAKDENLLTEYLAQLISGNIWKSGCNWEGGESYYNLIKENNIVIGIEDRKYEAGDLILICENYDALAIAKVLEIPKPVTNIPELKEPFIKLNIPIDDTVNVAKAEWYELEENEKFTYQLQAGLRKIQDIKVKQKVVDLWNNRNSNYWVFQGNPDTFDFETAFKEDLIDTWTVSAHKDKIKPGDKVIIWITGKNAGCYALAEITSSPHEVSEERDSHLWKKEDNNSLKAGIKFTHKLFNNPLLSAQLKSQKGLENLNVGLQGTNFKATEEQYQKIVEMATQKNSIKYWLYAPGEKASKWDEFYEQGIMGLGWDKLGDLNQYSTKDDIVKRLQELENTEGSKMNDASANFDFKNSIQINDVVIVKKGRSEYLGYGIVQSDYFFDKNRETFQKCRKVNWIKKGNWNETSGNIVLKTLTDITQYTDYVNKLKKLIGIDKTVNNNQMTTLSKNIILYGPPGTGKTYNSIDKAVEIVTGSSSSDHSENKKQFDELRKQGQIEFVTFHQNYSYEDFMVGIRPDITEGAEGLKFKRQTGIFYEISKRARENYTNSLKDATTISYENWVKNMLDEFKDYVETIIEKEGKFTIKNAVSIYGVEDDAFIYTGEKSDGEKWKNERLGMHYTPLITVFLNEVKDRKDIKSLENIPSLEKQHATYVLQVIQLFRDFLKKNKKEFSKEEVASERLKKYVLIIDEINRANISKVFGELITLLEDDKRLGEPNELKITLPNGEKEFGVPPNLYIIGTMNTADKSIALIDIALRRRFEFVGYYPIYEGYDAAAIKLLKKINETIYEKKKSADYLIGHAYFMKNQSIETVLKNKVLPLLMEYFSGKTEIVSSVFNDTDWSVNFNTSNYSWDISSK